MMLDVLHTTREKAAQQLLELMFDMILLVSNSFSLLLLANESAREIIVASLMEFKQRLSVSKAEVGLCKTVEKDCHPVTVTSSLLLRSSSISLVLLAKAFARKMTVSSLIPVPIRLRLFNAVLLVRSFAREIATSSLIEL
mmetsp:Transcript_35581/g.57978  ORF Transcript_35581/g.57978 Transcript_35581/m.57978 type:complete len:140 (-) Transcript_35581:148-567(-)